LADGFGSVCIPENQLAIQHVPSFAVRTVDMERWRTIRATLEFQTTFQRRRKSGSSFDHIPTASAMHTMGVVALLCPSRVVADDPSGKLGLFRNDVFGIYK